MMKRPLITGITGQDGSYLAGCFCLRVTMSTAWYVDPRPKILNASLIYASG